MQISKLESSIDYRYRYKGLRSMPIHESYCEKTSDALILTPKSGIGTKAIAIYVLDTKYVWMTKLLNHQTCT